MNKLFCFGYGYSAEALATRLRETGDWQIAGTTKTPEKLHQMELDGVEAYIFPDHEPATMLAGVTHILISIPPNREGCPVFQECAAAIQYLTNLKWLGYCSTTGVYGDADGAWVDETSPANPTSDRAAWRLKAEQQWLGLLRAMRVPTHIFRLAGIYGPGRSVIDRLNAGTAQRIVKDGHHFSRIHVEDIAKLLQASIHQPRPGEIYNLCDDLPAPSHEVMAYAAELLEMEPPPAIPYEQAELSDMAKSFYADHKRVRNDKIKSQLGLELAYSDYKAGLRAIAAARKNKEN